jgi:hypothetical protein
MSRRPKLLSGGRLISGIDVTKESEAMKRPEPETSRFLSHGALTHATTKPSGGLFRTYEAAVNILFVRVSRAVNQQTA